MNYFTKTRLIATFGPSLKKILELDKSNGEINDSLLNNYENLVNSGVDVFRFNMSHENMAQHEKYFKVLRELNKHSYHNTGILIDTMGPEIRVQKIQNNDITLNNIKRGQTVKIYCNSHEYIGNGNEFSVSDFTKKYKLSDDVKIGDTIYIDDGKLLLEIIEIDYKLAEIKTISISNDYEIRSNKRVNLFNKSYSLPFLNSYDIETIKNAVLWDADYLALSFVSNLKQINDVKKIIKNTNAYTKIKLIAKIETYEAIQNIEEIVNNVDGIMIARGDLSLEIGWEKTPVWQDKILKLCEEHNKISIVATQMLDSLENKIIPTRAEVTDCYYAAKMLTDATMLSGETASGHDPLNAIQVMKKITTYSNNSGLVKKPIVKNIFKKFYLFIISLLIKKNTNVILSEFNEEEIRLISSKLIKHNFYLIHDEICNVTKYTLYKNISVIKIKSNNNIYMLKNNKMLKFLIKLFDIVSMSR